MGTNLPGNVVEVGTLPQNVAFVSEKLRARFGDAIVVQGSQPDQLTACTRTDCVQQPWRGGLKIYPEADPGGYCSSAFAVYEQATGNIFLLTAGHCLRVGDKWKHSTATLGRATRESFYDGSRADAGLIDINNDWGGYYVFQSSSIPNRSIWSVQNIYDDRVGQPVNKSATTTGFTMGKIVSIDYDADYGGTWIYNQRVADYSVAEHDSGGSVFFNTLAMGVQSGKRDSDGLAVYTQITSAIAYMDVRVCLVGSSC